MNKFNDLPSIPIMLKPFSNLVYVARRDIINWLEANDLEAFIADPKLSEGLAPKETVQE